MNISEQLYNDFTAKLLPQLGQGFQVTKDYFTELFGRYVQYLIVNNTVWLIVSVISLIGGICMCKMACQWYKNRKKSYDENYIILAFFGIIILIVSILGILSNANDLVKDIYVPEIRILEIIKNMN